jgi:hypothetical protein
VYFCALETGTARKLHGFFQLKCRKGAILCTQDWIYSKERSATPAVVQKSAPFRHLFVGTCYSHDKKSGYVAAAATQELSNRPAAAGHYGPQTAKNGLAADFEFLDTGACLRIDFANGRYLCSVLLKRLTINSKDAR